MKKIWVFILGIVTGIILTFGFFIVLGATRSTAGMPGLNAFEQPGDCLISKSSLEVFQVLSPDSALAKIKDDYTSAVYLLVNNEGKTYYDDQVIKLPAGMCFRQIGTYQYETKSEFVKTVPVVMIMK